MFLLVGGFLNLKNLIMEPEHVIGIFYQHMFTKK